MNFVPKAKDNIMFGLVQGPMAYKVAETQARQGVEPGRAAQHAYNATGALLLFLFWVGGPTCVIGLCLFAGALSSPSLFAWGVASIGVALWLTIRMLQWYCRPANLRARYLIPTWSLFLVGALVVYLPWVIALFVTLFTY